MPKKLEMTVNVKDADEVKGILKGCEEVVKLDKKLMRDLRKIGFADFLDHHHVDIVVRRNGMNEWHEGDFLIQWLQAMRKILKEDE